MALKSKTIIKALQLGVKNQIYNLIFLLPRHFSQLFRKIYNNDKIALIIGIFSLLYCQPDGEYRPFIKEF